MLINKNKIIFIIFLVLLILSIGLMATKFSKPKGNTYYSKGGCPYYELTLPWAVSSDGALIACKINTKDSGRTYESRVLVIDISEDIFFNWLIVSHSAASYALCWYPESKSEELFFVNNVFDTYLLKIYQAWQPDIPSRQICSATISSKWPQVESYFLPREYSASYMDWDPTGQILIFMLDIEEKPGMYLAVSHDRGKTVIPTDIHMSTRQSAWADSNTLYIVSEGKVLEIDMSRKKPLVKQTIFTGQPDNVGIFDFVDGDIVYYEDDTIFKGQKVLYKIDNQEIVLPCADGSNLAFLARDPTKNKQDSIIFIINSDGKLINKLNFSEKTFPIGLCPKRNCIYLIKNLETIEQYDITDTENNSVLFDIDNINYLID